MPAWRYAILIRCGLVMACLALPAAAWGQQAARAPGSEVPVVHYKAAGEWPDQPRGDKGVPAGAWSFTQVASVAVKHDGNILVLHRNTDPILEFAPGGKFIGIWGDVHFDRGKVMFVDKRDRTAAMSGYQGVYGAAGCAECGAHSIRVDPEGNVWAVDATGQVVYKMNPQGHLVMTLGTHGRAGQGPGQFYLPTDVAFAPNGDVLVSDGYGNARIVRYSHDGRYLSQFGVRGNGAGQFQLPHNLVVDAGGKIYITDRDNQRVEIFDANGTFAGEWDNIGGNSSLALTPDQHIWTGIVLRDLKGHAIERLPTTSNPHGATVAANGDVYLGLLNGRVEKFIRQ
jgi:DNA-binding beta-propeller fold protein YncE